MKKIVTKNGQEFYVWGSRKEASKEIALIVEGMKCAFVEGAEMDDSLYIKYTDGRTYFFNKFEETGKFRKTNFDTVIFSNDCISVAYGKVVLRNVDDCDEFYSPEKDSEEKIWYFDEKESEAIRVERKIMSNYDFKFYVNGREFKTLCNTVKNAETFGVKFTVGGHTITAEISDKCFFKTIDGIELNGVKTDYYICKDYLNMNEFIYKLNDSFSTFINTVLTGAVGTVDVLLCKILEKVEMVKPETKETVTATEIEPEMTTEIETAEETEKKTEIAVNMLKYGIPKTKFLPTEIFDTKEELDYWFESHKFPVSLNRVFILKDTFTKRTCEGLKKFSRYTAEITLKNIVLESGLLYLMNEIKNHGFEVNESDFFGCKSFIDCYVTSGDRSRLFIENNESGTYIEYQYHYELECDNMEKILNFDKFAKALIKSVGITKAKEVTYTVQGVKVFFEFNGSMYKCYTPQSKLYKLSGERFNLITWRDLKKESDETDDISESMYTARSPPESSLLNLTINKLIKREDF